MPDKAMVKSKAMPIPWPTAKNNVLCHPCCNESLMQNMTPIPGERMFANDVIKNNVNNDIDDPHGYDTLRRAPL